MSRAHVTHQLSTPKLILPQDPFPPLAGLAGGRLPGQAPKQLAAAGQGADATTKQRSLVLAYPPSLTQFTTMHVTNAPSINVNWPATTAAGDLLLYVTFTQNAPIATPAGFALLASVEAVVFLDNFWLQLFAIVDAAPQGVQTIVLPSSTYCDLYALEVANVSTVAPLDQLVTNAMSGVTFVADTTATAPISSAPEFAVAAFGFVGGGLMLGGPPTGGFSLLVGGPLPSLAVAIKFPAAIETEQSTLTSLTSQNWAALLATFH